MSVRQPKSCCIRTLTLGGRFHKKETIYTALYSYFFLWEREKLYCIGFVFILVGRRQSILHCIHTCTYRSKTIYIVFKLAAPIIRSAAANSYMYDIHYIHIIHTYSYIEFIYYAYVITYRATFNNKLTTP